MWRSSSQPYTMCTCGDSRAWLYDSKISRGTCCKWCGAEYALPKSHSNKRTVWDAGAKQEGDGSLKSLHAQAKAEGRLQFVSQLEAEFPELVPVQPKCSADQALHNATQRMLAASKKVDKTVQKVVELTTQMEAARRAAAQAVVEQSAAEMEEQKARAVFAARQRQQRDGSPPVDEFDGFFTSFGADLGDDVEAAALAPLGRRQR